VINTTAPQVVPDTPAVITVPAQADGHSSPTGAITRAVQSARDRRDALTRAAALVDAARDAIAGIPMGPVLYGVQSPSASGEPILTDLPIRPEDAEVLLDAARDLQRLTTSLIRAGGAYGAHLQAMEVRCG
jgi:hypothetical protein